MHCVFLYIYVPRCGGQAGTGLFINTADYPTASDFRACALFTDDSTGKGTAKFRLRRTDHAGGTIFFEDDLGHTYSAMGLYHMTCGAWRPVSSISCGSSWGNTCQMDAMHTEGVSLYVYSFFLEYRASLARDVCRFAPVINRVADNTVALFKIGAWSDWQYRLSDAPVYCPEGEVTRDFMCCLFFWAIRLEAIASSMEAIATTVTPLKYVEGGPGLILPEVVYNSYSVRMFGGDGRLRIFKCAVPSSFTTIKNSRIAGPYVGALAPHVPVKASTGGQGFHIWQAKGST